MLMLIVVAVVVVVVVVKSSRLCMLLARGPWGLQGDHAKGK